MSEPLIFKKAMLIIGDTAIPVTDVVITLYEPAWYVLDFDDIHMGMIFDDLGASHD